MCTLSVQVYSDITSVNLVFLSDKIFNNSDNFGIKCLFYGKISAILCSLYFCFYTFLFNLGKYVNWCEKISFSLLYLTLVTSRKICPFLCCHLLYLIIYFKYTNPTNLFIQHNRMSSYLYKIFVLLNSSRNAIYILRVSFCM